MRSVVHGAEAVRVLYFTVVPIFTEANGGHICCRNHIRRLSEDSELEVTVLVAGRPEWQAGTDEFLAELGVAWRFVATRDNNVHPEGPTLRHLAAFAGATLLQTPWDLPALNQQHVCAAVDQAIGDFGAEVLVIDYTPSARYLRLPRTDVKTCLIKLNREGDFYRDLITHSPTHHGKWTRDLSVLRWRAIEARIEKAVDQIVTIGPPDIPNRRLPRPAVCVTPYLDQSGRRWSFNSTKQAFFVGGIHHYPNRLAIEWIATKLAPELWALDSGIALPVVGVSEAEVSSDWRRPNVHYLGSADRPTVERLFLTADCMLCPVENDFGCKFKAAEALAFGAPLLASDQTLLGLPYLPRAPSLPLADPATAGRTVCGYLNDSRALNGLAAEQQTLHQAFVASQSSVWGKLLRDLACGSGRTG